MNAEKKVETEKRPLDVEQLSFKPKISQEHLSLEHEVNGAHIFAHTYITAKSIFCASDVTAETGNITVKGDLKAKKVSTPGLLYVGGHLEADEVHAGKLMIGPEATMKINRIYAKELVLRVTNPETGKPEDSHRDFRQGRYIEVKKK